MAISGRWLSTAFLIGCASAGPTNRPVHPAPDDPSEPPRTPDQIVDQLESDGFIPTLDRTDAPNDANSDGIRDDIERYIASPGFTSKERVAVLKIVWDFIGTEFAGRHEQYEKFYAGASFIVRNHSFREAPWDGFHAVVDELMRSYDVPPKAQSATQFHK